MRKVIQMSQRQISGNGEEKSMSLQEVFLVNHSPSQAKERERMITAISGLTCSGPYMRSGPIGSLVRTLLASSRWYSPVRRLKWEVNPLYSERVSLYLKDDSNMLLKPFAVILNAKDIPSSRYLYRLVHTRNDLYDFFVPNFSTTIHQIYSVKFYFIGYLCISVICRCFHLV